MDANLHDYTKQNPPEIHLTKTVMHPTNPMTVIGHVGFDKARRLELATFPRKMDEHWFRGDSSSGLSGYGVSESVLDNLDLTGEKRIDRIIIIETDTDRVIEYDRADFKDATLVAYSPDLDQCVIGDDAMRVGDEYTDFQRVIPVDEARQVFDRSDVTISQ